jgi:choline dehydrogenase
LQGVFSPASYREGFVGLLDTYPGMTCGVWQHRPYSVGFTEIASSDPFSKPVICPNYLEDERDREVLLNGMRLARRLLQTPELAHFSLAESLPGLQVQSDDELLSFARRLGTSCYHLNGTARMGLSNDRGSVVDDQLRVHGVLNLRIIDASVMPTIPSANTWATTMMIAEKASDLIRSLPPLEPVTFNF